MLYKDPQGIKSGVFTSQKDTKGDALSSQTKDSKSVELEMKVTLLEKTIQENEKTIAELKSKIDAYNSVTTAVDKNVCTGNKLNSNIKYYKKCHVQDSS